MVVPLDFMASIFHIGVCLYRKWTNNLLMVDLNLRIALVYVTYIANLDAYELHLGDEKVFNDFIDEG